MAFWSVGAINVSHFHETDSPLFEKYFNFTSFPKIATRKKTNTIPTKIQQIWQTPNDLNAKN